MNVWKKALPSAFQGNLDLYLAIGLFGLAMIALVVLAVANGFHKHGGPF